MPFFLLLIVVSLVQIVVNILQCITNHKIQGKMGITGNYEFLWSVMHKPMHFFSQRLAGDIMARQDVNGTIANTLITVLQKGKVAERGTHEELMRKGGAYVELVSNE